MYKFNPEAWLKWAPAIVGLTALAGGVISTPSLRNELKALVEKAAPDLKVDLDVRDAVITGEATSQGDIDAAVKAVAGTYGVRRVDSKVVVVPPVKLATPTFTNLVINQTQPQVSGSWPEGAATTLAVTLAGKTYTLGNDADLTSSSGTWTLKPAAPLADGTYDVGVEITDGKKAKESVTIQGALVVDTVAPAAAFVTAPDASSNWPYAITGSWPAADAKSLALTLGEKTFSLGTDSELTSDKDGSFKLESKQQLAPGSYDLKIDVGDAAGNITSSTIAAAVVIAAPKTPEPASAPQPEAKPEVKAAPAPATIAPLNAAENPVVISGTWDSALTKDVQIGVAGKSWNLQSGVTANPNGTWSLQLPNLPDGTYDVAVSVTGNDGTVVNDTTKDELVIDTAPPTRPNINAIDTDAAVTTVTGTYGHADTTSLAVAIPAAKFVADSSSLTTDGDTWTVTLPAALSPGFYDVQVSATDSKGRTTLDNSTNEITIVGPPAKKMEPTKTEGPKVEPPKSEPPKPAPIVLAAPTVDQQISDKDLPIITGTWPAGVAKTLAVTVAGETFKLGKAPYKLLSSADGKWKLTIDKPLPNGIYDVEALVTDGASQKISDSTKGEITISVPPPPPPPKKVEPPKPAPVVLIVPTVDRVTSDKPTATVTGTWTPGAGNHLAVAVAGTTYKLGESPYNLLSGTNGKWKLNLDKDLKNGIYDIVTTATSDDGQKAVDATVGELEIAVPPPPEPPKAETPKPAPIVLTAPTVDHVTSDKPTAKVTGSWTPGAGKHLTVAVAGTTYTLGAAPYNLLSGTNGKWTLNVGKELKNGIYDVVVTATSDDGQKAVDATVGELEIAVSPPPEPPKAEPPPPAPKPAAKPAEKPSPYDCNIVLEKISAVFPIRFEFARTKLVSPYDATINQYVALLKDPRCVGLHVTIEGHADYIGPVSFNQLLSDLRAEKTRDVLVAAGVDPTHLSTKGFSEMEPLDPSKTDEARAKNRRVQFRAQ
jgi:outer membrane protein OmpA-like peptidoglycan-associated protein